MSSSKSRLALIVLVPSLVLAGCIGDSGPRGTDEAPLGVAPDWWVDVVPSSLTDEDHDHSNRSQHAGLSTPNFEVLGWDPLITDEYGTTLSGMGCGGAVTRDDERRIAIIHSISTTISFVVADITDPEAPEKLGEFYLPNGVVWDADISADGKHVIIGAYPPGPLFGRDPTLPIWLDPVVSILPETNAATAPAWAEGHTGMVLFRNACTGDVVSTGPENHLPGPAILLVGIEDPTNPVFQDYVPQPVIGPHSVGSHFIGDTLVATSSVTNLVHEGSYYTFFEIAETPLGHKLQPLSVIQTPGLNTQRAVTDRPGELTPWLNGHLDVFIHEHLVTGQHIAYLANWDGVYTYDMSDPRVPLPLGMWQDGQLGSIHTTFPVPYLIDDKQYLIAGQEVGEPVERPTGWIYILDVTDPAAPSEVGRWTLPVKPKWDNGGLQFSTHYVDVYNDTLFVTVNHAGLWAVDITDPAEPRAFGVFVPDRDSPQSFGGGSFGPYVGDLTIDQATGVITIWDAGGGIYQLTFDRDMPAERAPEWGTADAGTDPDA